MSRQRVKFRRMAAKVVHAKKRTEKGTAHAVGIGDLRVMVVEEEGHWFAQGLEIDYAADGLSLDDVKRRFEDGLSLTIREHVNMYGSIHKMLRVAPQEVWSEFFGGGDAARFSFTQVSALFAKKSLPKLTAKKAIPPFSGIAYYRQTPTTQEAVV